MGRAGVVRGRQCIRELEDEFVYTRGERERCLPSPNSPLPFSRTLDVSSLRVMSRELSEKPPAAEREHGPSRVTLDCRLLYL